MESRSSPRFCGLVALVGVALLVLVCRGPAFVAPLTSGQVSPALRGSGITAGATQAGPGWWGAAAEAVGAACSLTAAARLLNRSRRPAKTAARYTTQTILPSLSWLKTGLKSTDIAPCELKAKTLAGNDVLVGKTESGTLFCVGNLCPHIGTPMSEGADVIGDVIVCPLHGSSFKTTNGELIDWCPSPPIIGPLTGLVVEKKNLLIFDVRS
eukprot:CAMPEP_0180582596 /NCGR_PEP_ID=MMETSP1037_2-20121125/14636_1 /TAXON_ID=632150 /ORGANISM="Azadinium spinosum, Strain 3D9" /LENGTH=210 /DNA_ID=CAMNT_0022600589 /DNA_START=63 /DNA_END=691 /DNA_ORIENTATION=+